MDKSSHTPSLVKFTGKQPRNLAGELFHFLVPQRIVRRDQSGKIVWECKCLCGNFTEARANDLCTSQKKSCGCHKRNSSRERMRTHGGSRLPEFRTWIGIRLRCHDPRQPGYPKYGGSGIKVCRRWRDSFRAFLDDMGPKPTPRHSIDRIDSQKGYVPGNCRWATRQEQSDNRRTTVWLTFSGERLTLREWSIRTGLNQKTIYDRLRRGWTIQDALSKPAAWGAGPSRSTNCGLPEYRVWIGMNVRCHSPKCKGFARYGGRGIYVCQEWRSRGIKKSREQFLRFLKDMGRRPSPGHTLDRIDNNGPYSSGNCRWATFAEQLRNRRTNRQLTFCGETLCLVEWAERYGINPYTLHGRLRRGWSLEDALTKSPDASMQ